MFQVKEKTKRKPSNEGGLFGSVKNETFEFFPNNGK